MCSYIFKYPWLKTKRMIKDVTESKDVHDAKFPLYHSTSHPNLNTVRRTLCDEWRIRLKCFMFEVSCQRLVKRSSSLLPWRLQSPLSSLWLSLNMSRCKINEQWVCIKHNRDDFNPSQLWSAICLCECTHPVYTDSGFILTMTSAPLPPRVAEFKRRGRVHTDGDGQLNTFGCDVCMCVFTCSGAFTEECVCSPKKISKVLFTASQLHKYPSGNVSNRKPFFSFNCAGNKQK